MELSETPTREQSPIVELSQLGGHGHTNLGFQGETQAVNVIYTRNANGSPSASRDRHSTPTGIGMSMSSRTSSGSLNLNNNRTSTSSEPGMGIANGSFRYRDSEHEHGDRDRERERETVSAIIDLTAGSGSDSMTSPSAISAEAVVTIRHAVKRYGSGPLVLHDFGMTVKRGTIYSLLGASGCGKTTVLTCILGLRHVQSGQVLVFGEKPGTEGCGVPGDRVGYMPQEIALYGYFSITETLRYYGALYGMSAKEVQDRQDFLLPFLDLPDATRRIGNLSCGQKRRVSLAVAIIHSPELLILDEPTVGVDSLLREKIWNYLVNIVSQQKTTVIITTHYIEETRQSHAIGLVRGGRLLAEDDPATLLRQHGENLLGDIVLRLCRDDAVGDGGYCYSKDKTANNAICAGATSNGHGNASGGASASASTEPKEKAKAASPKRNFWRKCKDSFTRTKALILKNIYVMMRNLALVVFMIMVPSSMATLICLGVGRDPQPMKFGIVNHEANRTLCNEYLHLYKNPNRTSTAASGGGGGGGDRSSNSNPLAPRSKITGGKYGKASTNTNLNNLKCDLKLLSCRYLDKLPKDVLDLTYHATDKKARERVRDGRSWGFISFPHDYTKSVYNRTMIGNAVDNRTLRDSFIYYELDMTNKLISGPLIRILTDTHSEFFKDLLIKCGLNPDLGEKPLRAREAIYGSEDTKFTEFLAPSMMLGLLFFFPLCSSSIQYIYDKKLGTLERARTAGVNTWEIMFAFCVTEGLILLIQSTLTLAIITVIFDIQMQGSWLLSLMLSLLMGFAGASLGFIIASVCNEEIQAALLAMACFFPNFLLSGVMWPIEGMPLALQYVSYILPCTFGAESIRSIISRGWGLTDYGVWPGFATLSAWIVVYWTINMLIHKIILSKK